MPVEATAPVEGIQADAAPAEAEVEPKKAEPAPQEEKFAAKFAALSRKEKALRAKEAQLQQQMQEMQAKLKALESQGKEVETYKSLPDRLKREPLKVLEEQGLSFEQLAQIVLNDGKPTQEMVLSEYEKRMMTKMQELEQKIAEKEANEAKEREEVAITQFKAQLTDFANTTADYELIRANDAVDLVFEVIEQHHSETGEILSNKEACDAVEEYLLEEAKKLVDREKVKKLLQPAPEAKKQPTAAKTLSNAAASQAPSTSGRKLSDEESKAEAAKLIKWID